MIDPALLPDFTTDGRPPTRHALALASGVSAWSKTILQPPIFDGYTLRPTRAPVPAMRTRVPFWIGVCSARAPWSPAQPSSAASTWAADDATVMLFAATLGPQGD